MSKLILLSSFVFLSLTVHAQWSKFSVFGNTASGDENVLNFTLDKCGNKYLIVFHENELRFPSDTLLTNIGGQTVNTHIVKLDGQNEIVWKFPLFLPRGDEQTQSITLGNSGEVFLNLISQNGVPVIVGFDTLTSTDFVILCLDSNGIYKWSTSYGYAQSDVPLGITIDAQGNPLAYGRRRNDQSGVMVSFDKSNGTRLTETTFGVSGQSLFREFLPVTNGWGPLLGQITSTHANVANTPINFRSGNDGFLAWANTNTNVKFIVPFNSPGNVVASHSLAYESNRIYAVFSFDDTVSAFGQTIPKPSKRSLLVVAFDTNGTNVWNKVISAPSALDAQGISIVKNKLVMGIQVDSFLLGGNLTSNGGYRLPALLELDKSNGNPLAIQRSTGGRSSGFTIFNRTRADVFGNIHFCGYSSSDTAVLFGNFSVRSGNTGRDFGFFGQWGDSTGISITDTITGSSQLCQNSPATFSLPKVSGLTYSWSSTAGSLVIDTAANTVTLTPSSLGNGSISVVASSGCLQSNTKTLNFLVVGGISVTLQLNGNVLSATGGNFTSFKWFKNGVMIPDSSRSSLVLTDTGSYTVEVEEGTCKATSSPVVYSITSLNSSLLNTLAIYPNPAKDVVTVEGLTEKNCTITIFSAEGKLMSTFFTNGSNRIDISLQNFSSGVYLLQVRDEANTSVHRIIVQ